MNQFPQTLDPFYEAQLVNGNFIHVPCALPTQTDHNLLLAMMHAQRPFCFAQLPHTQQSNRDGFTVIVRPPEHQPPIGCLPTALNCPRPPIDYPPQVVVPEPAILGLLLLGSAMIAGYKFFHERF